MPRQNRVSPFGEIISTEARGTLMGNRGCLHDESQRIRRPFACRRWIICVLEFRGRSRSVMTPGRYTELFFLDEATALAAGHRPCAECQHDRYLLFRDTWAAANRRILGALPPSADDMDRVLHGERVEGRAGKRTYISTLSVLPVGTMIADTEGVPWLVLHDCLLQWEPARYTARIPKPPGASCRVLTPASTVNALAHGYPVAVHTSTE